MANFSFSRNDAGSIQAQFVTDDGAYDLESNGVIFSLGTHTVAMTVTDAAQGLAALRGRNYAIPDDIKELLLSVLAHRIILNEEASLGGENADHRTCKHS